MLVTCTSLCKNGKRIPITKINKRQLVTRKQLKVKSYWYAEGDAFRELIKRTRTSSVKNRVFYKFHCESTICASKKPCLNRTRTLVTLR